MKRREWDEGSNCYCYGREEVKRELGGGRRHGLSLPPMLPGGGVAHALQQHAGSAGHSASVRSDACRRTRRSAAMHAVTPCGAAPGLYIAGSNSIRLFDGK